MLKKNITKKKINMLVPKSNLTISGLFSRKLFLSIQFMPGEVAMPVFFCQHLPVIYITHPKVLCALSMLLSAFPLVCMYNLINCIFHKDFFLPFIMK